MSAHSCVYARNVGPKSSCTKSPCRDYQMKPFCSRRTRFWCYGMVLLISLPSMRGRSATLGDLSPWLMGVDLSTLKPMGEWVDVVSDDWAVAKAIPDENVTGRVVCAVFRSHEIKGDWSLNSKLRFVSDIRTKYFDGWRGNATESVWQWRVIDFSTGKQAALSSIGLSITVEFLEPEDGRRFSELTARPMTEEEVLQWNREHGKSTSIQHPASEFPDELLGVNTPKKAQGLRNLVEYESSAWDAMHGAHKFRYLLETGRDVAGTFFQDSQSMYTLDTKTLFQFCLIRRCVGMNGDDGWRAGVNRLFCLAEADGFDVKLARKHCDMSDLVGDTAVRQLFSAVRDDGISLHVIVRKAQNTTSTKDKDEDGYCILACLELPGNFTATSRVWREGLLDPSEDGSRKSSGK